MIPCGPCRKHNKAQRERQQESCDRQILAREPGGHRRTFVEDLVGRWLDVDGVCALFKQQNQVLARVIFLQERGTGSLWLAAAVCHAPGVGCPLVAASTHCVRARLEQSGPSEGAEGAIADQIGAPVLQQPPGLSLMDPWSLPPTSYREESGSSANDERYRRWFLVLADGMEQLAAQGREVDRKERRWEYGVLLSSVVGLPHGQAIPWQLACRRAKDVASCLNALTQHKAEGLPAPAMDGGGLDGGGRNGDMLSEWDIRLSDIMNCAGNEDGMMESENGNDEEESPCLAVNEVSTEAESKLGSKLAEWLLREPDLGAMRCAEAWAEELGRCIKDRSPLPEDVFGKRHTTPRRALLILNKVDAMESRWGLKGLERSGLLDAIARLGQLQLDRVARRANELVRKWNMRVLAIKNKGVDINVALH